MWAVQECLPSGTGVLRGVRRPLSTKLETPWVGDGHEETGKKARENVGSRSNVLAVVQKNGERPSTFQFS